MGTKETLKGNQNNKKKQCFGKLWKALGGGITREIFVFLVLLMKN